MNLDKILTSNPILKNLGNQPKYIVEASHLADANKVKTIFSEAEKNGGVIIIDDMKDSFSKISPLPLMEELDERNPDLQFGLDFVQASVEKLTGKNLDRVVSQVKKHIPVVVIKGKDTKINPALTRNGRIDNVLDIDG